MKKLIIILTIILTLVIPTAVFADDPPDVDVDVAVVTPGDVDLDVDIDAGGDVNVTVDGYDMDGMAGEINALERRWEGGSINSNDWWRYYYKYIKPLFDQLFINAQSANEKLDISMEALIGLIESDNLTYQQIGVLNQKLFNLASEAYISDTESKERDDVIWNQLMYVVEAHLTILGAQLKEQAQIIVQLRAESRQQIDSLRANMDIVDANRIALHEYTTRMASRHLYYIWGLIAGCFALLAGFIVLLVKYPFKSRRL